MLLSPLPTSSRAHLRYRQKVQWLQHPPEQRCPSISKGETLMAKRKAKPRDCSILTLNLQVTVTRKLPPVPQHQAAWFSLPVLATSLRSRSKHPWIHAGSPRHECLAYRTHRSPASSFSLHPPFPLVSHLSWPQFPSSPSLAVFCPPSGCAGLRAHPQGHLEPSPAAPSPRRDVGSRQNCTRPRSFPGQAASLSDLLHFSVSARQHPDLG